MKKFTFLFAILLGMVFSSVAQPKIGVRAGYNLTNTIAISPEGHTSESKSAANFGIVTDFRFSKNFVLRPGLYYSMKGYKIEGWEVKTLQYNLNYLEMPLLAVFQIPLNDKINIEFQTGLYFAYGVNGESEFERLDFSSSDIINRTIIEKQPTFKDNNLEFERFDCGINVGFGLNIHNFYIGISDEVGLKNITPTHYYKYHHNCFSVNLGYNF